MTEKGRTMNETDWCYPGHVIGFGKIVDGDSEVVPVVCEDGQILAKGDRQVWCDVREVIRRGPDTFLVDGIAASICGTQIQPGSWRTAWADDVAALDIEEPIWRIGGYSSPGPRRAFPSDDSIYWVGVGRCGACSQGSVAIRVSQDDSITYVCDECDRCWSDRGALSHSNTRQGHRDGQLPFASADQVAADWWSRFERLLAQEPRDSGAADAMANERWTIRLRPLPVIKD